MNQVRRVPALNADQKCISGTRLYKGRSYYQITDSVKCQDGVFRVKLAFKDGTSSFWAVTSETVVEKVYREPVSLAFMARSRDGGGSSTNTRSGEATGGCCDNCGRRGVLQRAVDSSGIAGRVCARCANSGGLSFA